ncbi:hypothetical protein HYDPIDRAFT_112949 [Hydnomerulius pinastri MD-312]|uniref:F-box domain-containing protein n=1 Tax=Hydnomerulius pinastri MD-312 TaxID=994086 RepID=A0A0C9WEP3_9AGAM|nr:hypothetical protein HYDPIDRAFT_112949 [Hydnomerulius pinastri MD-312]
MQTSSRSLSIHSLPNELLLFIFECLYSMHCDQVSMNDELVWELDADLLSPTLFPFAQMRVCQRWRAVLLACSMFWTRIVIAVDEDYTPVWRIKDQFLWSRDQPVDVFVTRHPGTYEQEDLCEKTRVAAILPLISRHLHRCRRIEFKLLHLSSLPEIRSLLSGEASVLEDIGIDCHIEDVNEESVLPLPASEPDIHISTPRLTSLTFDGRSFFRSFVYRSDWFMHAPQLHNVFLTSYDVLSPNEVMSINDMLDVLSKLEDLWSLSVYSLPLLDADPNRQLPSLEISELDFFHLTGSITATIFACVSILPEEVSVIECSFLGVNFLAGIHFHLEDISPEWNLSVPFSDIIRVSEMDIVNCPGFTDDVLDVLTDGGPHNDDFSGTDLQKLSITRCTNFSAQKMYEMIRKRWEAVEEQNPGWHGDDERVVSDEHYEDRFVEGGQRPVSTLRVSEGPELPDEYRVLLKSLVPVFHWTVAGEA